MASREFRIRKKKILASYINKNLMLFSKSDISSKIIEKSNKIKSLKEFVNFFTNVVNYTFKKENSKINNLNFFL